MVPDTDARDLREKGVDDIIPLKDDNPPPQVLNNIENATVRKHASLSPEILKINNEIKDDTFIKSNSTNLHTTLRLDEANPRRISKSAECLPQSSPMASCMMLPATMSLEDIASNNKRLSTPENNKNSNVFMASRLMKRLKGLKVTF